MGVLRKSSSERSGAWRRFGSKLLSFGLVATSVTAGVVLVFPALAGADSPNPMNNTGTAVVNPDGTITVTVQGEWDWQTHRSDCNKDRFGTGWNVDWNDPSQPGHEVDTLNGVMIDVGVAVANARNPFDNTVHYSATAPYCGVYDPALGYNTGTWGPLTHTYPAGTTTINPCAVTYDIHGKLADGPNQGDLIAGGKGHNGDNSVEKNSAPAGNTCAPIIIPNSPILTLEKVVDNSKGGNAVAADFTLAASGPTNFSGKSGSAAVTNRTVTAGTYTLSETQIAGYGADTNWVCTGGTFTAPNQITVVNQTPAQNVICRITNRFLGTTDLTLTKSVDNPTPIAGGAAFNYTIAVSNVGSKPLATSATIVDVLPAGLEYVNAGATNPVAGVSCTAPVGARLTCTATAAVVNAGLSFTIPVRAPAGTIAGPKTNVAFVHVSEDPACVDPTVCVPPCPPQNNNVGCSTVDIKREAALKVTKTDDVAVNVKPGDSYNYVITVQNMGPSSVTSVKLTDALPAGLAFVSGTGTNLSCVGPVPQVSCDYSLGLAPTAITTNLTIKVTLDATYTSNNVHNVAVGTAVVEPGKTVTADDDEDTPVLVPTDLVLTKAVDNPTPIAGGAPFNYTITVTNVGSKPLTGPATVVDVLPAGLEYVNTGATTPAFGVSCNAPVGQRLTCSVAAAQANAGVAFTIAVRAPSGVVSGAKTNVAFVHVSDDPGCVDPTTCVPPCPPQSNNVGCSTVDIKREATLKVIKDDAGVTVKPGDSFQYTITVQNVGPSSVTNVVVTDALPGGLSFVSGVGSNWSCVTGVSCSYGPGLNVGDTTSALTLSVTLASGYTLPAVDNIAVATAIVEPGKSVTAQDPENTPVTPPQIVNAPSISIVKRVNGSDANAAPGIILAPGATMVFTYEVTNTGNVALSNVSVTDDKNITVTCPSTTLAVGASMVCNASGTAPASGQYTNVGTATGTTPTGTTVTAKDQANAFVSAPGIRITKFVNGADANTPPGLPVVAGEAVTWTYRVENTGNVDLVNITVVDDQGVSVDCGGSNRIAVLKPGEQHTCSGSGLAILGLYTNVGTATGTPNPPGGVPGTPIKDDDSATYTGAPNVVVQPPPPSIPEGTLPETGSESGAIVGLGAGFVVAGLALMMLAVTRRRSRTVS